MALLTSDTEEWLSLGCFLRGASPRKDVCHRVVSLVARVLKNHIGGLRHGKLCRPRAGPCRRIVDGEFVQERVCADACKPFDQVEITAGSSEGRRGEEVGVSVEVRRVDDQR